MTLILKNATFIHWETLEFIVTHILVEEGAGKKLRFFKKFDEIQRSPDDNVIDCSGKYVTKSFAIGHHHVYSALARGMPAPVKNPQNFREILQYIWWNLDKALDKESIEASALATAMACAKAGATFAIDHHASPNFIEGSLEIIAAAFEKVGVEHLLCYEITDRDGQEKAEKGLVESENYLKNHQGLMGLHASFTVSDNTMKKAANLMEKYNSGVHVHVAEDLYDQEHCVQHYNKRVVERLNDFGFLNSSKTILVHGLHLDETEREILKNSKAYIAQNMESNLKNKVGYFNGKGLAPGRIILGTDGMHSDMLQSAKAAFFVGQKYDVINYASAYQRFRNVHRYLELNGYVGDGDNNLVVLDYDSPTPFGQDNFLGHFIFGLRSNHVQHVISNGRLIVKNQVIQHMNENEILDFTQKQAKRLWNKLR
ncbi:MAG: amidohydrolase family protein [Bacteroidales bacterium]|nr:amidohydrolase family protein [Bacteroidales bacterium]MDZ4204707.1 amidohydrolase family protein [Bacteroidales bacterium]